jgi:hypothetical protein
MSEQTPKLAFAATSVPSLLVAVRSALESSATLPWEEIAADVSVRAEELVQANRHMAQDAPGEQWLRTSSVILAAYQHLSPVVGGPRLLTIFLDALAKSFREQITGYLESRFGISEDAPREAFHRISENFQKRGEQRFGSAFRYTSDVQDATRNFVNIERCFFNAFFRANGATEVTPLFCALDKVWAEALEQPRYGVRFERPTTLARGDDVCRFQFHKVRTA